MVTSSMGITSLGVNGRQRLEVGMNGMTPSSFVTNHTPHQSQMQEPLYSPNVIQSGHYAQLPYHQQQQQTHQQHQPQSLYQTNGSIIVNPMSQASLLHTQSVANGVQTTLVLGTNNASCFEARSGNGLISTSGDFVTHPDSAGSQKSRQDYIILLLIFLGVVVMVVTAITSCVYLIKCESASFQNISVVFLVNHDSLSNCS